MPAFLSNLTETDFSWLQKRHGKFVGRGSFCIQCMSKIIGQCTRATSLQHQPFSALAAFEKTSCVYPKMYHQGLTVKDMAGFRGCKLTIMDFVEMG